jgi:hypothetical protein
MHDHHFVHHDYFWRNILLRGRSLSQFFLIDSHKGRCWHWWSELSGRAKDLATLDSPAPRFFRRTERLRFFLRYREHRRLTTGDKDLVRLILRLAKPLRASQLDRVCRAQPVSGWCENDRDPSLRLRSGQALNSEVKVSKKNA